MKYYEGPKGVSIKKITEGFSKREGPDGRVVKRLKLLERLADSLITCLFT